MAVTPENCKSTLYLNFSYVLTYVVSLELKPNNNKGCVFYFTKN